MNEERFRSLMRDAIGDVQASPWLSQAVRTRIARPETPPSRAGWVAAIAVCVVVAFLVGAIAPRLLHPTTSVTPGAGAGGVDPTNCTLPVIIYDQTPGPDPTQPWDGGTSAAKTWGLLNTHTGKFAANPSASPVPGMPVDLSTVYPNPPPATGARLVIPPQPALAYSHATGRWLPVLPERVSPDGQSYVYQDDIYGSTVVRYDIATGKSVVLWSAGKQIYIIKWIPNGILVGDSEPTPRQVWLVNPVTGVPTVVNSPPAAHYNRGGDSHPPVPLATSAGAVGLTASGDPILKVSVLGKGTVTIWVYYYTAAGKRIVIYHKTGATANVSDVNGVWFTGAGLFDPAYAFTSGDESWFSTFAPSLTLWHWDATRGLKSVDIGVQDPHVLTSMPAGPCF